MDLVSRIKGIDKKQAFLLIVLFLFAFGIRGHLAKYDLIFGFDSYFHARMNGFVIENGYIPEIDEMGWYTGPEGGAPIPNTSKFFWVFNAMIYKVVTLGAPYNKELWIEFVKVLPALYGALICIAMFFFGKELYGKKAGYAMAFFAATVPAFVYRTMGGFFEEDALGFLWMVIGFVFFAKAIKKPEFTKKKMAYAVLSGVMFGIMAFTWEMFLLIPLVLSTYILFAMVNVYAEKGLKGIKAFTGLFALSMASFTAITYFVDSWRWIELTFSYLKGSIPDGLELLVLVGGALIIAGIGYLIIAGEKSGNKEATRKTVKTIGMLLLYGTLLVLAIIIISAPELWKSVGVHGTSVGEENFGKFYFGEKYNALIIIPALALLLIPWRVYRKKNDHLSIIVFFWVFATFFMAWYKLKFTYTFGLPIAAAAGLLTVEIFHYLRSRTSLEKKTILLALGIMFLIGASAASLFVEDKVPSIETNVPQWKAGLEWLRTETPEDAKMFNWWDYGHWISFLGERAVLTDNRNIYGEQLQDVAKFIITHDVNEALDILERHGSDYIILNFSQFQGHVSYAKYAFNTINLEDPRLYPYRVGPTAAFPCGEAQEDGQTKYVCGPNVVNQNQIAAMNRQWTQTPSQLFEGKVPIFVYLDKDMYAMYILNPATNSSMMARLWFNDPEVMQYFEESYAKGGIKIFRIKKEKLAQR